MSNHDLDRAVTTRHTDTSFVSMGLIEGVNSFIGKVPMWKAGQWLELNWPRLEPQLRQALHDAMRVIVLEDENHHLRQRIESLEAGGKV